MSNQTETLPKPFIWRRFHSLMGLWLVLYLILHLFTNSQAALLLGESGAGFVRAVNGIHEMPYLNVIEILFIAFPFLVHTIWGIKRLFTSEVNSYPTDGSKPSLPEYSRNQAFTWQRITSWMLVFLIAAHVIHMRFLEYPASAHRGAETYYMTRLNRDVGLYPLAVRLGFTILSPEEVEQQKKDHENQKTPSPASDEAQTLVQIQKQVQNQEWIDALNARPLEKNQVLAVANNFGTAELLMVRDTFKLPTMLFFYTVLVISSCFHGFNGLWTAFITWGVTISPRSQIVMRRVSNVLMVLVILLGLAAIWMTYWVNLIQ